MRFVVWLTGWLAWTMAACTTAATESWQGARSYLNGDSCDEAGQCPTNSPVIGTYVLHDLSTRAGEINDQGLRIDRFTLGASELDFRVEEGRILAKNNGVIVAQGRALLGGLLWLRNESPNGANYIVKIADVTTVGMWALLSPDQVRPRIEVYRLQWTLDTGEVPPAGPAWKPICEAAMPSDDHIDLDVPAPGGGTPSSLINPTFPPFHRSETYVPRDVIFVAEGDRLNAATREVVGFDPAWFNIGCAGHLLAKMHLMGHVAATAPMGYAATIPERQAMMKMLSADYCGTGKAFTVSGVRVQWHDHRRWFEYSPYPAPTWYDVEARWDETGATCLGSPRHATRAAVTAECPTRSFPACDQDEENFAGAHIVTVNPRSGLGAR
jgi:hypothetical protein